MSPTKIREKSGTQYCVPQKILGILGGMGPEATAYFYKVVVAQTRARVDQEHIPTLIWSDPVIPPRTDGILGTGPSPLPRLLAGVRRLEKAGEASF